MLTTRKSFEIKNLTYPTHGKKVSVLVDEEGNRTHKNIYTSLQCTLNHTSGLELIDLPSNFFLFISAAANVLDSVQCCINLLLDNERAKAVSQQGKSLTEIVGSHDDDLIGFIVLEEG